MIRKRSAVVALVVVWLLALALPVLAQDGPSLDEEFVSSDGALTLNYPTGWTAEEFFIPGMVIMANSEDALNAAVGSEDDTIPSGGLMLAILGPQAASLMFEGAAPATLAEALILLQSTDESGTTFGEVEDLTLAGHSAQIISASGPQGDGAGIVIEFGDSFVFVSAIAAAGEYGDFEDVVLAILDTITYTKPEGMITFTSQSESLVFEYPAEWQTIEIFEGNVLITNNLAAFGGEILPGMVSITVNTPDSLFAFTMEETTDAAQIAANYAEFWVEGENLVLADPVDVMIGDHAGVQLGYTTDGSEGHILALDYDGAILVIQVAAAPGELGEYAEAVEALVMSIVYTPVEME